MRYACTYVNIVSLSKHNTILILYVRQLCETILSMENVEYCVWYAWLHYDVNVPAQGRIVFLNENVDRAMCVERDRFFLRYGYSEL